VTLAPAPHTRARAPPPWPQAEGDMIYELMIRDGDQGRGMVSKLAKVRVVVVDSCPWGWNETR